MGTHKKPKQFNIKVIVFFFWLGKKEKRKRERREREKGERGERREREKKKRNVFFSLKNKNQRINK